MEEQHAEISWEEAVSRFLRENPDYFDRNPHILNQISVPHPDTGRAVSLIERQVVALRSDNNALQTQLRELIDNATENDAVVGQIHRLTLLLLSAESVDAVINEALEALKNRFNLDTALILLYSESFASPAGEKYFVSRVESVIQQLSERVSGGESVCGFKPSKKELLYLFGDDVEVDGSLVLVPIQFDTLIGILVLGSSEPDRFVAGMSTTYLNRIGELLAAAVLRFTDNP